MPTKIKPCSCVTGIPGIVAGIRMSDGRSIYRVGCTCGQRGLWTRGRVTAVRMWNRGYRSDPIGRPIKET